MKRLLPVLFIFLSAAALSLRGNDNAVASQFPAERKLRLAEAVIENYYVDSVDADKMVEQAIIAMLKTLDPHSAYSTAEETRQLNEPLEGNFSGIGVRFQMLNDTLYVIETIPGGPSEEVGILPGDRILECNDTVIAGVKMKNSDIMKILRGPRDTRAALKIKRRGVDGTITFNVTRRDIPINSVDAWFMADAKTGVVVVSRFAENTPAEMRDAIAAMKKKGMKNLIVDLTGNSGGYLKSAYEIANMFLRKGDMLVFTDAPRLGRTDYVAEEDGILLDNPVVIMVDQYSASAAEILAGAVQDNDRGVIVGRRTFGKGLVQRPFPFPDGSMMRLTVSKYYTPSGRCIQKPYVSGDPDSYFHDITDRYNNGELLNADSAYHYADSLLYRTIRHGRPVYGGGGIMPDVNVPLDTTFFTPWYRDVVAKGVLNKFCVTYVENHRKAMLKSYPKAEAYIDRFDAGTEVMKELVDAATAEGIEFNQEQYDRSAPYLVNIVKALIGRDLYGQDVYYRVAYLNNPIFLKAREIINSPDKYTLILNP
ncbi:MAG: S41 family peptidase [Duncaniella sp.]|nr:S41 family peptidase [Duncaniella sp.]